MKLQSSMERVLTLVSCFAALQGASSIDYASDVTVQLFQEYLRINTTTYNDLTPAVEFWRRLAAEESLPINEYEFTAGYPVIVIKWEGIDPSLSGIMLNSHMDVVPAAEEDGWTYPPFEANIDENGDIYARGSQDMKSVSIQYFEALRRLKANNVTLLRNVYMTLMPDEEVGADHGMIPLLQSEEFTAMNIGVEMDEGTSYPLPLMAMFYQDKVVWQIQVDCYGIAAHGSTFPETNSTATGKCRNVVNRMLAFRDEQYEISTTATIQNAGIYTSVNLNQLNGGTANNVVPSHVTLVFDIRLSTTLVEEDFEEQLRQWIAEAGSNVTLTFISKDPQSPSTIISEKNPYWTAISNATAQLNITVLPIVPPGSTDARHVRNVGIPAFGFSPMPNTPLLLHSVDEHLNAATFLGGIGIYQQIIYNLANIPGEETTTERYAYVVGTA